MRAAEIVALARQARVGPGISVLDLCCGIAGPGRLIVEAFGCRYLGVDQSVAAIDIARQRTRHLAARFDVAEIPPLPAGRFDVVLLLETMLAFADKAALLREIGGALPIGGRLALTVEAGEPLTPAERAAMPDADTVHLIGLADLRALLTTVGLRVRWQQECSRSHLSAAGALLRQFELGADQIRADIGDRGLRELMAAHRLWVAWLRSQRVRKFALVAEKMSSERVARPDAGRYSRLTAERIVSSSLSSESARNGNTCARKCSASA